MIDRKLNIFMVIMGAAGGALGCFAGRALLTLAWPRPLLAALFMGALGLGIVLFCVLAETLFPVLNGMTWKRNYAGITWRYLVPATLLPLMLLGGVMQFLYQTDWNPKPNRDVYMLIDRSGSMEWNDPNNERLDAVQRLLERFDAKDRVEIGTFDHEAEVLHGLTPVSGDDERAAVVDSLSQITPRGGTDINLALTHALNRIAENRAADKAAEKRETMIILLSDGESEVADGTLTQLADQGIQVNTVGMLLEVKDGEAVLSHIARQTGGQFVLADDAEQLAQAFMQIYQSEARFLLEPKTQTEVNIWQWLLFTLAGLLIGLIVAFIFDNRYLMTPLAIGGLIGGLLAGALGCLPVSLWWPSVVLGCVFTWFTLFAKSPPMAPSGSPMASGESNSFLQPETRPPHGRF